MSGSLTDALRLVFTIVTILVLLTALDWIFTLPFLDPSRDSVRHLLIALEDLMLPMGSFDYQQAPEDDTKNADLGAEVPLLEQTSTEIDSLSSAFDTTSEETLEEQQGEEGSTATAEEVSTETPALEQQDENSTAAVNEVRAESLAFENAIRELVDPDGKSGTDPQKLVEFVMDAIKGREEAEKTLKSQSDRFKKAEEKWRRTWLESDDLSEENRRLSVKNTEGKEKRKALKVQHSDELRSLKAEKECAERAAQEATAGVENRITAVKERYEKEKSTTGDKNKQEQNSLICSKKMVEDSLKETQGQLDLTSKQHVAAIKAKNGTINRLKASLRQATLTERTWKEEAAADKQRLEDRLGQRIKGKVTEIETLKDQLRQSKDEVKAHRAWKTKAEAGEAKLTQLSAHWEEEKTTIRDNNDHVVSRLKLEKRGLGRAVKENEATIDQLKSSVTSLESGEEVRKLRSQLQGSKKRLQESAKEVQNAKQQLDHQQQEAERLRSTVEANHQKMSEEAKEASIRQDDLQKQLEEATRSSDKRLNENVQEYLKQKNELSRKLEMAGSSEQAVRTDRQRLEDEKIQTASEHQKTIGEKDELIRRLEQALQDAKTAGDETTANAIKIATEAQENASKTEVDLRAEMDALKFQVEKATTSSNIDPAVHQPDQDTKEIAVLTIEANEANNLLFEVGNNGVVKGSVEHAILCGLNRAKLALHRVKFELQKPQITAQKIHFVRTIDGANVNEEYLQKLNSETQLFKQANIANARIRNIDQILSSSGDIQKDAMLEALQTPNPFEREIRKPQGLKRPARSGRGVVPSSSSTGGQADILTGQAQQTTNVVDQQYDPRFPGLHLTGQPQVQVATPAPTSNRQDGVPTEHAREGTKGNSESIASILARLQLPVSTGIATTASVQAPTPQDSTASGAGPAEDERPPLPGLQSSRESLLSPFARPKRSIRSRVRQNGNSPSAHQGQNFGSQTQFIDTEQGGSNSSSHHKQELDQPEGWTDVMTNGVMTELRKDNNIGVELLAEILRLNHDFGTRETQRLNGYLEKLRRQAKAEKDHRVGQPLGWTEEMTRTVRDMLQEGDDIEMVEECMMAMEGLKKDGLAKWLEKLQSDFEAEKNAMQQV